MLLILFIFFIIILEILGAIFKVREKGLFLFAFIRFASATLLTILIKHFYSFDVVQHRYVVSFMFDENTLNYSYTLSIDAVSLLFLTLTTLIIFLCFIYLIPDYKNNNYDILLTILLISLCGVFTTNDLLWFYIFFESTLIPMFLIVGMYGSRERKIRAANLLFFYTIFGSLFLLTGILYMYSKGLSSFNLASDMLFTYREQLVLWPLFFMSFAFKLPVFPFHVWLPEAHVEAPTVGSVLLAGILLKLGVYGFVRFNVILFPIATNYYFPYLAVLCGLGIIYGSLAAIGQTDMKRIIAYSSVAHMNLVVLGLASGKEVGFYGGLLQSLSHGYVASGLFFLIGMLYSRYHSRSIHAYGGLVHMMPIFSFFFFAFSFCNTALPPSSSFIGEFLILEGIYNISPTLFCITALGVILSAAYSLWLLNRICFGNIKINNTTKYADLDIREIYILSLLFAFVILMGLKPEVFVYLFDHDILYLHTASSILI